MSKIWFKCLLALIAATVLTAHAQNERLIKTDEVKVARAQAALKKDEVCTKCHDESENAPVLSLYQTKHGVRGDARTPTCQSCHGTSDNHVKGASDGKGRPSPDVVFKKGAYAASGENERADRKSVV